jgi:drug/metabolite transporter (DMT)-like permease
MAAQPNNVWKTLVSVAVWFIANISTVVLNKAIYVYLDFKYPFTLTAVHMAVNSLGSWIMVTFLSEQLSIPVPSIDSRTYWTRVLPLAGMFCLNIVLGNISLRWIPVSFMQTIKSSVPACTLALQYLQGQGSPMETNLSIVIVVGGVILATFTEVNFNYIGFWTAMASSFVTAAMSVVSGILLSTKLNPITLLYFMAPASLVLLLPFVVAFESSSILSRPDLLSPFNLGILLLSGLIALTLNISQFFIIGYTSPLTFNVCGNLKVALSILVSVLIFRNQISFLNAFGCIGAILGCFWYSHIRLRSSIAPARPEPLVSSAATVSIPLDTVKLLPSSSVVREVAP